MTGGKTATNHQPVQPLAVIVPPKVHPGEVVATPPELRYRTGCMLPAEDEEEPFVSSTLLLGKRKRAAAILSIVDTVRGVILQEAFVASAI